MAEQPAPNQPLLFIRACISTGQIRWTYHVSMRLQQRSLRSEMLVEAVNSLEIIESYEDDKYLPGFLVRGEWAGTVFHARVATDVEGGNIRIVTMYVPWPDEWDAEFRLRRTQS